MKNDSLQNILKSKTRQLKKIQKLKERSLNYYLENPIADKETEYSTLWKAARKLERPVTQAQPVRKAYYKFLQSIAEKFVWHPSAKSRIILKIRSYSFILVFV